MPGSLFEHLCVRIHDVLTKLLLEMHALSPCASSTACNFCAPGRRIRVRKFLLIRLRILLINAYPSGRVVSSRLCVVVLLPRATSQGQRRRRGRRARTQLSFPPHTNQTNASDPQEQQRCSPPLDVHIRAALPSPRGLHRAIRGRSRSGRGSATRNRRKPKPQRIVHRSHHHIVLVLLFAPLGFPVFHLRLSS